MIHVESIVYFYNQGSDCGISTEICGQPLTNSDTGLITSCTGQPSPCSQYIPNYSNCTGSTVNYRCIPRDNGQDICQSKTISLYNSARIFLFSPNYPNATGSFKLNEMSCECDIRGTSITSITILDLRLKTDSNGVRSDVFIQYGDITYNKTSRENNGFSLQIYNYRLQPTTPTSTADITFTQQQITGQKLWIEIQGIALAWFCNNISTTTISPTPTPPRPDSTATPVSSSTETEMSTSTATHPTTVNNRSPGTATYSSTPSETSTDTSDIPQTGTNPSDSEEQHTDNDKDIAIIVLAILSFSLILVIVLYLMYRKGKLSCLNQPGNPETENSRTTTPSEPWTTYSNLSNTGRHNSDYQELQTRNSNYPYNNLPYSGRSEVEPSGNYSSLSDGNRRGTDNNNYLELQTRTPSSPYNNLPYTYNNH
ncbi:mucin-5AC-like [Patella vulgata]|uniref:mucin-5AC-like n=1 Tax=Patella vulgata TaxID=6465 RepID=UPI00217FC975|nr:mucin-5AC-like [Patella vulgata]